MNRKLVLILFFIISVMTGTRGEEPAPDISQVLGNLFTRLASQTDDADRLRINDSIKVIIDDYVVSDSVMDHRFQNIRFLGQITSPDSLVKILTWNLVLKNSNSSYFSYFIKKGTPGTKNKVFTLTKAYSAEPIKSDTTYSGSDWYGALYYDLRPVTPNDSNSWILLGIDYGNPMISRKIIDVVSFLADGSLSFGRKIFMLSDTITYRVVFEYSPVAVMSLRFHPDNSVVFDHLVSFSNDNKETREYFGPDYSSDAYIFEEGYWKLKINVDVRNSE